jgi:hypothetical protein
MSEELLDPRERLQVGILTGDAITSLRKALTIVNKAKERIVNGSVDVTIEYLIRDAIKSVHSISIQTKE